MELRLKLKKKIRKYIVGKKRNIIIKDCGEIFLEHDEQISFVTENQARHEVVRKNWGFYATQSINFRLKKNFITALMCNTSKRIYLVLIEKKKLKEFKKYCEIESQKVIQWL